MVPDMTLLVNRPEKRKIEQISAPSKNRLPLVPARTSHESKFRNFTVTRNRARVTRHSKMSAVENVETTSSSIEELSGPPEHDEENQSPPTSNIVAVTVDNPEEERKRGPRRKPKKIPRPPNSFIIFRSEHQGRIKQEQPDLPNTEISRVIGHMWHKLTTDEKKIYEARAIEAKQEHAVKHPTWKFCPKRRKRRSSAYVPGVLSSTLSKGLLVSSNVRGATVTASTDLPISGMVGADGSTYPKRLHGNARSRSLLSIPYPTFTSAPPPTNFESSPSFGRTTAITLSPSTSTIRDAADAAASYSRYPSSKPFDFRTTLRPDSYYPLLPPPSHYVYAPTPPSTHYHQQQQQQQHHPHPHPQLPPPSSYQHAFYASPDPFELTMSQENANYVVPTLDEDNMDGAGALESDKSRRTPNIISQHIIPTPPPASGMYEESMAITAATMTGADESNKFSPSATSLSQTSLFGDNRSSWHYKMRVPSFGMSPPVATQETAQELYLSPTSCLRSSPATLSFPPETVSMNGTYPSSNFIMGSQLSHSPMDFLLPPTTNRRGN